MFLFNSPKVFVEVVPKGSLLYVILDHKSSLKSLGYICSKGQKYIAWIKIINLSFMPKIIRILSKDHGSFRYFVNFLP